MNYSNLVMSILLLAMAGFIYNKFKINIDNNDKLVEINIIKKFLLNENNDLSLQSFSYINKPILWIHLDNKQNCRKWLSYGSRNSNELNQDYLYLTIRSIINKCNNYFHIILIDDESFSKLLENWTIDLTLLSEPQKTYFRTLGLVNLLYNFGGLYIEPSFILFKSLKPIYEKVLATTKMVVAEFINTSTNSHIMNLMPSTKFIGCIKNCPKMWEFKNHLEILFSKDCTNEINSEDLINKWLLMKIQNEEINYIDGKFIGTKDSNNEIIDLEKLLSSTYLDLNKKTYSLYIPKDDLLKRKCYNWFVYLNVTEVLNSSTNIGKYLLISNN